MRILLLSDEFPPDQRGGDGRIVADLARAYHELGHEVFVYAATVTPALQGRSEYEGIPLERVYAPYAERWRAWRSLYNPRALLPLERVLKEFRPEVVHAHGVNTYLSYTALVRARESGARVYLTAHDVMLYAYGKVLDGARANPFRQLLGQRFRYNPARNLFIRYALRSVTGVIAVSEALKEALENNGIKVVAVVHNGIDVDRWQASEESVNRFKQRFVLGNEVILFGGRLSGAKGGAKMIEALALVSAQVPSAQLLVIGRKDAYAERMLALAKERGVADRIVFTGWIDGEELVAAYHAAAVVAVPSLCFDSFPTINLEAMACARPVVATCFSGSPEAVLDGETGYLVDPHDVGALARAFIALFQDSHRAHQFGKTGFIRVTKLFTLTQQAQKYLKLFEAGNI